MSRFYLAAGFATCLSSAAMAQSNPPSPPAERPPLGSTLTVEALGTLPASATIFSLLDTAMPDVISDRLDTGGLSAGQAARVGAHGSTWTQTLYRLGEADITAPDGSGTPLLIPGVAEWDRVDVATGFMPVDASAPGMAVSLVPRKPSSTWSRWLDLFGSPAAFNAGSPDETPPPIARLNSWANVNLAGGGPVADRTAIFLSGSWTRSSHFERNSLNTLDANMGSIFANLVASPTGSDAVRVTGWFDRTRDPIEHHQVYGQPTAAERDLGLLSQFSWDHQLADRPVGFSLFGSYAQRGRTAELQPASFVVLERLNDGPVPDLLTPGDGTDRVLHLGAHLTADRDTGPTRHHAIVAGLELTRSSTSVTPAFGGSVGETVNGIPARLYVWTVPAGGSAWHSTTLAAYVADTMAVTPRFTFNFGLRFESLQGAASDGGTTSITWNDWYPRGGLHIGLTNFAEIAAFLQFGRYGHKLPLGDLAYGDPTAPTAAIYRWYGGSPSQPGSVGPLVERLGPGSGGDPNFSSIDPALKRPAMNEMTFGFESRPKPYAFVRMAAIARYESPLVGVVDIGVPASAYTTISVPDYGVDIATGQLDQTVTFYNRSPSSFGADRFLLSNPADDWATFVGVDLVGEVHAKRLFLIAGGTAGRSEAISANRGFGPLENDAGLLGEVFIDPNDREHAQGRVFTERGYTLKTAASYQFDNDFTAGLVARYEDGQHFARMVVLDTLNQGAEAVRAFRNGRTRFTFSMTVDARVQKAFAVSGHRFTAMLDAYNLFNQALSVEEAQVTGAGPRQTTAVQPPRVLRVGVRVPF